MPQQTAKNGFPFLSWQSEKSKSPLFAPTIQLLSSHTNKDDDCEYHTCSNSWKLSSSHHTWPQNSSAQNKTSFLCILKPLVMNQSYKWYVLTRCLAPNHNYITWNRQTNHIARTVPKHVILGLFVWFLSNSTVPVMIGGDTHFQGRLWWTRLRGHAPTQTTITKNIASVT